MMKIIIGFFLIGVVSDSLVMSTLYIWQTYPQNDYKVVIGSFQISQSV
jgi:hypothetical protein